MGSIPYLIIVSERGCTDMLESVTPYLRQPKYATCRVLGKMVARSARQAS